MQRDLFIGVQVLQEVQYHRLPLWWFQLETDRVDQQVDQLTGKLCSAEG